MTGNGGKSRQLAAPQAATSARPLPAALDMGLHSHTVVFYMGLHSACVAWDRTWDIWAGAVPGMGVAWCSPFTPTPLPAPHSSTPFPLYSQTCILLFLCGSGGRDGEQTATEYAGSFPISFSVPFHE